MIYNVPLSAHFPKILAHFILEKYSHTPLEMAKLEVLLPTKRACRFLKDAFLEIGRGKSFLLPQLKALYELEDIEENLPEALPSLKRTLMLARLCKAFPEVATADRAIKMAVSLGEVLDEVYQFETSLDHLDDLQVEDRFAQHWNETVRFLDIIRTQWPSILKQNNLLDETQRRILLINAYIKKIQTHLDHHMIMAGFDGSLPCVIRLANVLKEQENADLFFYGVDEVAFQKTPLSASHYQFNLQKIIQGTHLKADDMVLLGEAHQVREDLLKHAFCMPKDTQQWKKRQADFSAGLNHVHSLVCATAQEEALSIALILREVLATPGKTAVVISNNRALAERICGEMKRWGIALDDSAGIPFTQTPTGIFFRLVLNAAQENLSAPALLALLKHPFCKICGDRERLVEQETDLRKNGKKLTHPAQEIISSFALMFSNNNLISFKKILSEHIKVVEALTGGEEISSQAVLWDFQEAQTVWQTLSSLLNEADDIGPIDPKSYSDIFDLFVSSIKIRPAFGTHPRLEILGPIEARLTKSDVCILADLNEGNFPQLPETGPWLNKAMRQQLKLPELEQKIGITAFDFAQHFMADEVYLTRSVKADGTPTVVSRFLLRLEAFLETQGTLWKAQSPALPALLDKPVHPQEIIPPCPMPPVEARPKHMSVTKIEAWMRDPYSIYANSILKLKALPSLEESRKQQEYGIALHRALSDCFEKNPTFDDEEILFNRGKELLFKTGWTAADLAYYLPKWKKICTFVCQAQHSRQNGTKQILTEKEASFTFTVNGQPFTLTGIADRIDVLADNSVEIIDYKTGYAPTPKEVKAGFAPQLPLEAFLVQQGGFKEVPAKTKVANLSYWKLSGKDGGKVIPLFNETEGPDETTRQGFANLTALVELYQNPKTVYPACPVAERAPKYNDYEHLERVKEWRNIEGDEENDT